MSRPVTNYLPKQVAAHVLRPACLQTNGCCDRMWGNRASEAANLKALLCKAAVRTSNEVSDAIGSVLDLVSPAALLSPKLSSYQAIS